jgi:TolA-binding protein
MKYWTLLAAALPLSLPGCGAPESATARQTAIASTTGATTADDFRKSVQEQVQRMNERLNDLKDRAAAAGAETRQKLQPQIDQLERDLAAARGRLDQLGQSSRDAWNAARPELEKALRHLGDAFNRASEQFKK